MKEQHRAMAKSSNAPWLDSTLERALYNQFTEILSKTEGGYRTVTVEMKETIINNENADRNSNYYFATVMLRRVMRCTESIFRVTYEDNLSDWPKIIQPVIGHKVEGLPVKKIALDECALAEAVQSMVNKFCDELKFLLANNIDIRMITAIADFSGFGEYRISSFLDAIENAKPEVRHLISSYENARDGTCIIYNWNNVSSMEFPVVIFLHAKEVQSIEENKKHKILKNFSA